MTSQSEVQSIIDEILQFRDKRDWEKFHEAKNLAISLSVESSELLELFLWESNEEVNIESVKDELADVFYSALLLAEEYGLDVKQIIRERLGKNALKYPVGKAKGSNKKYGEL